MSSSNIHFAKRVLIVEDEEEIRELLEMNLSGQGIRVVSACSGNQAIEVLAKGNIDFIVSDVKMSNGSGIDLLKYLNKNDIKIPFIFLTAYHDLDEKELIQLGALKIFPKPTRFVEIIDFIKTIL